MNPKSQEIQAIMQRSDYYFTFLNLPGDLKTAPLFRVPPFILSLFIPEDVGMLFKYFLMIFLIIYIFFFCFTKFFTHTIIFFIVGGFNVFSIKRSLLTFIIFIIFFSKLTSILFSLLFLFLFSYFLNPRP